MAQHPTPLRYPGGKNKLANFMREVVRLNNLVGGHYVEPYAGGASIALHLLFDGYVEHVHINDLNPSIFAFWHSALNDGENLCRLIQDTPVNIDEWKKQKAVQRQPDQHSVLELAFSTFFLNRTNHSGILTGGAIGGKSQTGTWLLDARYNKLELIARIKKITEHRDGITLYNRDAADIITEVVPLLPEKTLIYLDPPYYAKGGKLYQNSYKKKDHVAVSLLVSNLQRKWIVSYDNTRAIRNIYQNFGHITYKLNYSARDAYKGSEIIFFSENMMLPTAKDPTKVVAGDRRTGLTTQLALL